MMRIYFCPSCGCWRIVSNRLKADCLECSKPLLLSDIPFEHWVRLNYRDRAGVAAVYLQQIRDTAQEHDHDQASFASIQARKAMERILGEAVPSNQPEHEDTGYDY